MTNPSFPCRRESRKAVRPLGDYLLCRQKLAKALGLCLDLAAIQASSLSVLRCYGKQVLETEVFASLPFADLATAEEPQ